jgi:hypothetical protein
MCRLAWLYTGGTANNFGLEPVKGLWEEFHYQNVKIGAHRV